MALQSYPKQPVPEPGTDDESARRLTPNWFSPEPRALDAAAERYRAMRSEVLRGQEVPGSPRSSLLDLEINRSFGLERETGEVSHPQKRAPFAPSRQTIAARASENEFDFRADDRPRSKRPRERAPRTELPLKYIAAGLAAILTGGLLGYGATHYKAVAAKADEIAGLMRPRVEAPAATDAVTIVGKKTIATATLNVSDVSGELNSMIPLMLHAEPAEAGEDLVLKLSGLPQSAYLTAGAKAEDNAWQIAAADAAGVKLVVPQTNKPSFDVAVAAFEAKSGELAAPIKEMTVAIDDASLTIAPAAALPENVMIKTAEQSQALAAAEPPEQIKVVEQPEALVPAEVPEPKEEQQIASVEPQAQNLLTKGDILLKSGDLGMARQFYERAFAQGSAEAALGAGKTYDPAVYAELKVHGLKPDPALAMEWYLRASAAGNTEAAAAIEDLKQAEQ